MSDQFSRLYQLLQEEEQKKCIAFFKTQGEKENALFTELRKLKNRSSEELAGKIYGDKTKTTTLRQLRKQVNDKLLFFLQDKLISENESQFRIRRLLDFTDFLISRHAPDLALEYLIEAEREATAARSWQMLNTIFEYKLTHAVSLGIEADKAFEDWEKNSRRYHSLMHVEAARNILTSLLHDHRRKGIVPQQGELMNAFYERFAPNEEEKSNPHFMLGVALMFRQVMLSTKDYWRIEEAVSDIYTHLKEKSGFGPQDDGIRRSFMLILAQACYRNRNFNQAETYIQEAQKLLPLPISRNDPGYAKIISLRAGIFTYTNRCEQASDLLRKHLYGPEPITNEAEKENMQLNLAVNYFCMQDYQRSLEQLSKLNAHHTEYLERHGLEWLYKKRMIDMIVHYESHQYEEAEAMLVQLMEDFADFLKQDLFIRAKLFMEFVLRWFRDSKLISDPNFHREIKDSQLAWGDREDIQAILFFSWLRAHMLNKPFYLTLMNRMNEVGKDWNYPFGMR